MKPLAIFYHALFYHGTPPELRLNAVQIVQEQMWLLQNSGLAAAASEIVVGLNGPVDKTRAMAALYLPAKARLVMHGPDSFAENLTIVELEKWVPHHLDSYVLYFHAKGCTHPVGEPYGDNVSAPWRRAMMQDLIANWRECVAALDAGAELVCSHFMRGMADGTQNIAAGNFFWARASFLATLPSIFKRDRIKESGIAAAASRYEAEVWIGNGPRLPRVKEFRPNGGGGVP